MVTPLQIDSYTRDFWNEFDALAIAQLAPVVYDPCYRPKVYVGLDMPAQFVPANGYSSYGLSISPGSLIYGFYKGRSYGDILWTLQVTDMSMGKQFWSEPVSQKFVQNQKGRAYPNLLCAPYPVVGSGVFLVEVWNQEDEAQTIVPLIGCLEVS